MKKIKSIATLAVLLASSMMIAPSAQAATFVFASQPLTNLNPDGQLIRGGFTAFPTKSGMYIQQCPTPTVAGTRPTNCIDLLWVTPSATPGTPGTALPTGSIAFTLKAKFTGKVAPVDCSTTACGLFFRLDHLATADTSEDTFLPISFTAGGNAAPALAVDEVTVTLNGKALVRNVPSTIGYRASAKIVATAKSGLPVTLTSLTPDCSYANGQFVALKGAGQCALAYSTAGNATVAAASGNFPFYLAPGTQSLSIKSVTIKKGATKALPATTNFGTDITYKSNTKGCRIELNIINAVSGKSCLVKATAPAKDGMWSALSASLTITIK